nr:helix-turn-helix domain-containing protein [Kibdelosporangium sp. MJ126-NF4]CEL18391.1 Mobile element protein [Kibdelosporangium sp. MJ126-NF4]CTQ97874.1 Mobile element protein [Kibdelosporangium sp. MJ126-NF4]
MDIRDDDIEPLREWSAQSGPHANRAAMVLMAADGMPVTEIARRLGTTRSTVTAWCNRYRCEGTDGLRDRPRQGRPRVIHDVELVLRTLITSPNGQPWRRWSTRSLASEVGASNGTVARVWRRWGYRSDAPHEFSVPLDPPLPTRIADVVGIHMGEHRLLAVRATGDQTVPSRRLPAAAHDHSAAAFVARVLARHGSAIHLISADPDAYRTPDVRALLDANPNLRPHVVTPGFDWLDVTTLALGMAKATPSPRHQQAVVVAVCQFVDALRRRGTPVTWVQEAITQRLAA